MINLLKIISIICIVIALFVGIPQFIKTIKILKELKKMNPDDITAEPIIKESFKIIKPMLVAISLYIISSILNFIVKCFLI